LDGLNSSSSNIEMSKLLPEAKASINKDEMSKLSELSKQQRKSPALKTEIFYGCNFPSYTENKPSQ
jgi:hypothetical protein